MSDITTTEPAIAFPTDQAELDRLEQAARTQADEIDGGLMALRREFWPTEESHQQYLADLDKIATLARQGRVGLTPDSYHLWLGHRVESKNRPISGILLGFDAYTRRGDIRTNPTQAVTPVPMVLILVTEDIDGVEVMTDPRSIPIDELVGRPITGIFGIRSEQVLRDQVRGALYRAAKDHAGQARQLLTEQTKVAQLETKIQRITERMHAEADERGWCEDFDDICDELDLPRRQKDYEVEVTVTLDVTVTLSVTAGSEDDALERADAEERGVIAELVENKISGFGVIPDDLDRWTASSAQVVNI